MATMTEEGAENDLLDYEEEEAETTTEVRVGARNQSELAI